MGRLLRTKADLVGLPPGEYEVEHGSPAHEELMLQTSRTYRIHIHSGWFCCLEQKKEMARRIQADQCVYARSHDEIHGNDLEWCITHNCEADYGHSLARDRKEAPVG